MNSGQLLLLFLLFCFPISLILLSLYSIKKKEKAQRWEFVMQGIYDHVEYGMEYYTRRSGSMVHTTSTHPAKMTAIFFEDGRTVIGKGHCDMNHPKGTEIKVFRNLFDSLNIQAA